MDRTGAGECSRALPEILAGGPGKCTTSCGSACVDITIPIVGCELERLNPWPTRPRFAQPAVAGDDRDATLSEYDASARKRPRRECRGGGGPRCPSLPGS